MADSHALAVAKNLGLGCSNQELLNQMDYTLNPCAKFEIPNLGLMLGTPITPRGWIFGPKFFHSQKIQVKIYLMRGQTFF